MRATISSQSLSDSNRWNRSLTPAAVLVDVVATIDDLLLLATQCIAAAAAAAVVYHVCDVVMMMMMMLAASACPSSPHPTLFTNKHRQSYRIRFCFFVFIVTELNSKSMPVQRGMSTISVGSWPSTSVAEQNTRSSAGAEKPRVQRYFAIYSGNVRSKSFEIIDDDSS